MRVLITGGAGFIGSHLCELLISRGDEVVVIDDFSTGRQENLKSIRERITLLDMDLADGLAELGSYQPDEIYHLAAAVGVRLVVERPIHTIETNVLQTSELLHWAGERGSAVLIASTSEVYGKGTQIPFSENDDVVYGPTTCPRWSYACSKAIDEFLALAYHRQHDLRVVIPRFFNTVGPRQVGDYGMVLPRFVTAALRGEDLIIHGDGQQTRSFCDVRDVVKLLPVMLKTSTCFGRVFNVGSEERITINELGQKVITLLKSKSSIIHQPYEQAFGPSFEDLRHRQPDTTAIREACGFIPQYTLDQTILDLAAHIRNRQATNSA